jgi:tetratricopeptide (TPR) repeat protein
MNPEVKNLSNAGRRAMAQQDWATVHLCANGILSRDANEPEGYFFLGLVEKASEHPKKAVEAFEKVIQLDADRYDAAIELASQYSMSRRNGEVAELLGRYKAALDNSPRYLDMAGTVYSEIGLPDKAWPLYQKANKLQPDVALLKGNLASCAVYVGEHDVARKAYSELLVINPAHQRNHYHLSRVEPAKNTKHIEQMERLLAETKLPPDRNIFLYFALGKEYEDLQMWDKAYEYFEKAGNVVTSIANYNVASDIVIIDTIIKTCSSDWLKQGPTPPVQDKTPLFVVGLPRTGTTLTERIVASHSQVASVGETEFVQMVMRRESEVPGVEKMTPQMIEAIAKKKAELISEGYLETVRYRLGDEPIFVDKLPFNVLYLGFIAKAWPDKPIILQKRNPMDTCFSMYKQVFTWAYKYSYSLETLGEYYIAYERLCRHWRETLGDRLVEIQYEDMVADQEVQTRHLLDRLGLPFEDACLNFEKNAAPSTTASSVQVRQKVHARSVERWRRYEDQLQPLREKLESAGIAVD